MSIHMLREVETLKNRLLSLSAIVEDSVRLSIRAIEERDAHLAQRVIEGDNEIDQTEVAVEEECLKILALYQPVAIDLRFIVAILKINNDLERIGDMAVNIAERAVELAELKPVAAPFDFPRMADKARLMLKQALDALVHMDAAGAHAVCAADDEVDAIHRAMYDQVKAEIRRRPENLDALIHLLSVSRQLERIADLATNIAEDVIYMVQARIVRHRPDEARPPKPTP